MRHDKESIMDIQNEIDVQCKKIADGLCSLREVTEQQLARKVLELETNLDSGRKLEQLIRLERSLLQYLERKGDLLYVGLMGHFSSGKSSTVNSLLNLWQSKQVRNVDLNPTDKAITLITDPRNSASLIGLKSEGAIPVRADFIESEFLSNVVLVDTPGSGDPLLVSEMVRDFLPVCDIILYFFSAATPLTDADTPLLVAKTRELKFIPMKFVVTRADEFRRDMDRPLSPGNYDDESARLFLDEIISRVEKILDSRLNYPTDFLIIDNRVSFNIDQLRNLLLSHADTHDSSNRVLMHGHKVAYFISHSQSIQGYFKDLLEQKTNHLKKIVDYARLNINRYQDKVQITNNKLTESWMKCLSLMEDSWRELRKKLNETTSGMRFHENPFDEEILKEWRMNVVRQLSSAARSNVSGIVQRIEQHALKYLSGCFQELIIKLNESKIDEIQIERLEDLKAIRFSANTNILDIELPYTLEKQIEYCPDLLTELVNRIHSSVSSGLFSVRGRIVALQPLKDYEQIITQAISSLAGC
jgi:predicted GTPase